MEEYINEISNEIKQRELFTRLELELFLDKLRTKLIEIYYSESETESDVSSTDLVEEDFDVKSRVEAAMRRRGGRCPEA